jgi:hypothetical protein
MSDTIAYTYTVKPDEPDWADEPPGFEPFESVTFEHPNERFENIDGVKATNVTPLHAK